MFEGTIKGEPALLLQSVAVTDANYIEAWKLLNERYQDKRKLVNDTLKWVFAMQPLQGDSATGMRRLVATAVECVRCLQMMERPVGNWGDILLYIITRKLDSEQFRL